MDFTKFFKNWLTVMIVVFTTMAIITFSLKAVFKQKEELPTDQVLEQMAEKAAIDAVEVALVYHDGSYIVDKAPKRWQPDLT